MGKLTGATFVIVDPSGNILMQLRDNNPQRYPNMWCLPGGTIEPDENPIETIIREVREEYELEISTKDCHKLMTQYLSYGSSAEVYVCALRADRDPVMHEGAGWAWMNIEEVKKLADEKKLGFEQESIILELEKFLQSEIQGSI